MPLGMIVGITKDLGEDRVHADGNITATRLTDCPRKVLIEDFVKPLKEDPSFGLIFDPRRWNSPHLGTIIHAHIAANTPGDAYKELHFPLPHCEPPILDFGDGVKCAVSGTVDYLAPSTIRLEDYKTHSETAHKFKWQRKAAEPELRSQFSIYKTLVEGAIRGAEVKDMLVWHGAMTSAKHPAPPWFKLEVPFLPLNEIGNIRAYGAQHTVRDVIKMYQWALGEIHKIPEPRNTPAWYGYFNAIVQKIPMVGETQYGGDKCTSYCGPAHPYCWALAGRTSLA